MVPVCEEVKLTVFTVMSWGSRCFSKEVSRKNRVLKVFSGTGTFLKRVKVQYNYQHYVLKRVTCVLLSSLASNSAVIGPT